MPSPPRRGVQRARAGKAPTALPGEDAAGGERGAEEGVCAALPPPPPRAGSVWGRGCGWGRCGAAGLAGPAAGPARPGPSAAPRPAGASAHIGCAGMGPSRPEPRLCHLSNTLHPACSPPPALPLPFTPTPSSPFFFLVVFGCWFFVLVFLVFFFSFSPSFLPLFAALASSKQASITTHPAEAPCLPRRVSVGRGGGRRAAARAHSLLSLDTLLPPLFLLFPPPLSPPPFPFVSVGVLAKTTLY